MLAYLSATNNLKAKALRLNSLVKDTNLVVLLADMNGNKIQMSHSPKRMGGTQSCPANKVVCLVCLRPRATGIILNEKLVLKDCNIATRTLDNIKKCKTKDDYSSWP